MRSSNLDPSFDEHQWMLNIRRFLEEDHENDNDRPISIFNVPRTLLKTHTDFYMPQEVAIGPYHYRRPELREMERYKIVAAKRCRGQYEDLKFDIIVDHLKSIAPSIRACYHKFLDFSNETLAWMMAIDSSFLLEFLQIYANKEGNAITGLSSRSSRLIDQIGRKSSHNIILRDLVMLENQIPLFVLKEVLEVRFSSKELANAMLLSLLSAFKKEALPFKILHDVQEIAVFSSRHLLDYLYTMFVPTMETILSDTSPETHVSDNPEEDEANISNFVSDVLKLASNLRGFLLSRLVNFPWTFISHLPGVIILKQSAHYFLSQENAEIKPENEDNKPPLVEEITIPSVTELCKNGVRFFPTNGDVFTVNFDPKTATFHLPVVCLDVNSEVVLRNLIAYEASNASGPLVFTRFTELMNGIIDTKEDAKHLRERGIILNRLKSDQEVANLWNGMTKSIRLTKVPFLDKVIEDVNKYQNGLLKVRVGNLIAMYVFGSWKFLTLLATIFLLFLMTFQAFCLVYACPRA